HGEDRRLYPVDLTKPASVVALEQFEQRPVGVRAKGIVAGFNGVAEYGLLREQHSRHAGVLPALTGKHKADFRPLAREPGGMGRLEARPHFIDTSRHHGQPMLVMTAMNTRRVAEV